MPKKQPEPSNPFDRAIENAAELRKLSERFTTVGQELNESATILEQSGEAGRWALEAKVIHHQDPRLKDLGTYSDSVSSSVNELRQHAIRIRPLIANITGTAAIAGATTSSAVSSSDIFPVASSPPVIKNLNNSLDLRLSREDYEKKLAQIDPSLVPVYRQAREQLIQPGSDPGRVALAQMRSLWNNFIDKLSPVEEVRNRFQVPSNRHPERRWHLQYVVERWVDPPRKTTMLELIPAHIAAYRRLQDFHTTGQLDNALAIQYAREALLILHQWIDAISPQL